MKRLVLCLVVVAVLTAVAPADALVVAPPPGPARVANADLIVVGKVAAIEPEDLMVDNLKYRIAVVEVKEAIRGAKDVKTVRVGFVAPPANAKPPLIRPGFRGVQLQIGQDGLFLLNKHAKERFHTLGGPVGYFISSENNANFAKDVTAVKAAVKVAEDPQAGLKAKDAETRLMAAAILIEKYRMFRGPGQPKQAQIDAAESKQILLALAEADFNAQTNFGSFQPNPVNLFFRLGVTAQDGWMPPPGANVQTLIPGWLRDNAEKYRVQRFVAGETK